MQNLLHEQVHEMQTEIHMARQMLAEITTSALALQVAIEKSSSQIAQMATLTGLTSAILQWGWVVLGIAVLYQFSSTFAGYAAAALGIACFPNLRFSWLRHDRIHHLAQIRRAAHNL